MKSIFVSSTFKDMQYERDRIQQRVLPELQDFAGKYGRTVDFIDLRWGVNTSGLEEGESGRKVLSVCLDEIEKSRPYMIVLLGERYGWMPDEELIRHTAEAKQFEQESFDESVTALEIEYGALKNQDQLDHCIFCFRNPDFIDDIDESDKESYMAESDRHSEKLAALKDKIRNACPDRVCEYQAKWDPEKGRVCGLEDLENELTRRIEALLEQEWGIAQSGSWQEQEAREAARFTAEKAERFAAREDELDQCLGYAEDPQTKMILIEGEAGSGKSTMISVLDQTLRGRGGNVLTVISGNTARSSTAFDVLRQMTYFMEELLGKEEHFGDESSEKRRLFAETPAMSRAGLNNTVGETSFPDEAGSAPDVKDINAWKKRFQELAYEYSQKFPELVYVLVDALDQLLQDDIRDKSLWLPVTIPGNITLILSCLPDTGIETELPYANERKAVELGDLSEEQIRKLIRKRLSDNHRDIDNKLIDAVVNKKDSGNPLYLSLIIQRLLMLDSEDFAVIGRYGDDMFAIEKFLYETVQNSPDALEELCVDILHEAAERINLEQCSQTVELIAVSRNGLREKDLKRIFENEGREYSTVDTALLLKYMKPMFGEREDGRIDFSHRTIREGIRKQLSEEDYLEAERKICRALGQLSDDDPVKLREFYHHCFKTDNQEAAVNYIQIVESRLTDDQIHVLAEIVKESVMTESRDWLVRIIESNIDKSFDFFCFLNFEFKNSFIRSINELNCLSTIFEAALQSVKTAFDKEQDIDNKRLIGLLSENLGSFYRLLGNLHQAEVNYRQDYEISKELMEQLKTPESKRSYAISCERLGGIVKDFGDIKQAEVYYRYFYEITKKLMEQLRTPESKQDYAISCERIGGIAETSGDVKQAEGYYRHYYKITKELMEQLKTPESKRDYTDSCERMGWVAKITGDIKQAKGYYGQDYEISMELMEQLRTPESKRSYAISSERMGGIAEASGDIKQAEGYYRQNYEVLKELMEQLKTPESKRDYAVSCEKMGGIAETSGDVKQAKDYYQYYYEISKELMEQLRTPESKRSYEISCERMGGIAEGSGDIKQAEVYYRQYYEISKELMKQCETKESKLDYIISCYHNGCLMEKQKKFNSALKYFYELQEFTKLLQKKKS